MLYVAKGIKLYLTIFLRLNIFLIESCFTCAFEEGILPSVLEYEEEAWVPVKYEEQDNSDDWRPGRDQTKVTRIERVSSRKPRILKDVFSRIKIKDIKRTVAETTATRKCENSSKNLTKRKSDNYIHFYTFGQSDNESNLRNDMKEVEKLISPNRSTPSTGSSDFNKNNLKDVTKPKSLSISNDYSQAPIRVYNNLPSKNDTFKSMFKQGNTVNDKEYNLSNDSGVQISGRQFNTQKMKPEKLIVRIPPSYDKLPIFVYKDPLSSKVSFSIVGNLIGVEDTTKSQLSSFGSNRISTVPESNNNLSRASPIYQPPSYGKFQKISRPYQGLQYLPYMQYPQFPYLSQMKTKAIQKNLIYPYQSGVYVMLPPPPIINFKMPAYNHWRKFVRLVRNPK